ncbi:hypothetical protein [Oharaeibacter diazotrophicus]|uniref:hypothetical protein n=1 Tax=Oharaeibacter diazotrophicus TaxID=1920512 RepID=UPI000F829665|nr:hypothetical protein [Oharaeibacter diazotrophicus]
MNYVEKIIMKEEDGIRPNLLLGSNLQLSELENIVGPIPADKRNAARATAYELYERYRSCGLSHEDTVDLLRSHFGEEAQSVRTKNLMIRVFETIRVGGNLARILDYFDGGGPWHL